MTENQFNDIEISDAPFPDPQGETQVYVGDIPGVGKDKYTRLLDNGFTALNDLYQVSESEITNIDGIGKSTAKNIKIWIGDKVINELEISDKQINEMSIEEIATLSHCSEGTAREIKERYSKKPDMTHISE